MKPLDRILRDWRFRMTETYIAEGSRVLDIGGEDGAFLQRISDRIGSGVCMDPRADDHRKGKIVIVKSLAGDRFPFSDDSFDVVSLLAVYEHLGTSRHAITEEVFRVLKPKGLAVLTVPAAAVDAILKVLVMLRLVEAATLDEHEHFSSVDTLTIFSRCGFRLRHWKKFQLGLNNLFVFEKPPPQR